MRRAAQMRSGIGWRDVHIHDVSDRGMMLSGTEVPPPGSYLEVRRGAIAIVARIVWRKGRTFGVRSQDIIDLNGLAGASPTPTLKAETAGDKSARRRAVRADAVERSRMLGRLFQYIVLLAAIGVGTVALAGSVASALAPLRDIQARLIGS